MRSLTFAKVADQLGHLFWMGLLAAAVAAVSAVPQFLILLMGLELSAFHIHTRLHHHQDGWLRHSVWWLLGVTATMVGAVNMPPNAWLRDGLWTALSFFTLVVMAGFMAVSFSIHRHRARMGKPYKRSTAVIIGGCILALTGAYLFRVF